MARPASAALVPVLTLLAGLAVGWATNPFAGDVARAAEAPRAAAPTADADAPRASDLVAARELAQGAGRTQAVAETAAAAPDASEAPEEPPRDPAPETLAAELTALLRSGRIERALAPDAARMLRYAVEAYLSADAPREALALLERHPDLESHLYGRVGHMLLRAEDREGAAQAFLAQLERAGPEAFDVDDLQNLAQADPQAALEFLDGRAGGLDPFLDQQLRAQRAVLLARTGRVEDTLALLRELSVAGQLDGEGLQALGFLPDEASEAFLREALAADAGPATLALAQLLGRTQRGEEATRLLRELLARRPDDVAALSTLFTLDPDGSLAYLGDPSRNLPPSLWSQAGHALLAQGRTGEAVDAWMRAFEADPSDWEVGDALLAHAPTVLFARAEQLAATTHDDEVLGDLADLHWRAGRHERAIELWRRARGIDPGDGEWSGKLRAAALRQDPL